ncbi:TniQ family protein [Ideonella sp. A 288]|uniref:TniQ family protein n=1 Tax=Ideonella sp. A 288 TaxID=1962181 RepID=UPI000B4BBAF0|nr:TniQ family protein [Ideonella sp. A 288]
MIEADFVRPEALPDELDSSYLGAVMRCNGFRKTSETVQAMARWARQLETVDEDVACVELLSRVAGMSVIVFVRQHTTLPYRRGITSYQHTLEHGSKANRQILRLSAMRTARQGAYLCEDCVKSDQATFGRSYWRRAHQLPGIYWCAKHRMALHLVESEDAYLKAPSAWLAQAQELGQAWVCIATQHPMVDRFTRICLGLLDTRKPIAVRAVRDVLRVPARNAGLRMHASGKKTCNEPLLSDWIASAFPSEWLATILPGIASKPTGTIVSQVDGVLWMSNSASSSDAYVLAACVLFESADEALHKFMEADRTQAATPKEEAVLTPPDLNALRALYIKGRGSYGRANRAAGSGQYQVRKSLGGIGLPTLAMKGGRSMLEAARALLLEELDIEESAAQGGVTVGELLDLIRRMAAPLIAALREMDVANEDPARVPRSRPSMPNRVQCASKAAGRPQSRVATA